MPRLLSLVRKQLAFMLGRQQVFLDLEEEEGLEDREDLKEIISNVLLNNNFLNLAREVNPGGSGGSGQVFPCSSRGEGYPHCEV